MLSDSILVFLNGHSARMPAGSNLGHLLSRDAPELAAALASGLASATDGRGIPVAPDEPLAPGAIFRVLRSARTGVGPADA